MAVSLGGFDVLQLDMDGALCPLDQVDDVRDVLTSLRTGQLVGCQQGGYFKGKIVEDLGWDRRTRTFAPMGSGLWLARWRRIGLSGPFGTRILDRLFNRGLIGKLIGGGSSIVEVKIGHEEPREVWVFDNDMPVAIFCRWRMTQVRLIAVV